MWKSWEEGEEAIPCRWDTGAGHSSVPISARVSERIPSRQQQPTDHADRIGCSRLLLASAGRLLREQPIALLQVPPSHVLVELHPQTGPVRHGEFAPFDQRRS